jgi:hypothetical protein
VAAASSLWKAWRFVRVGLADRTTWLAVEAGFIGAYVLLRSAGAGQGALGVWSAALAVLALAAPVSGLVVLVAIAPFTEPVVLGRDLGIKAVIASLVAGGVALRVLAAALRRRSLPRPGSRLVAGALVAACVLAFSAALGIVVSARRFGPEFGSTVAQLWLTGIGGGVCVLLAAAWAGHRGMLRPLWVAVGSASLAGLLGLVDFLDRPLVRESPVAWLLRREFDPGRLTGVIPSPNGAAALVIIPVAVLVAFALFGQGRLARFAAALLAIPLVVALYFTYSRSPILGLFLIAVLFTWRIRRIAAPMLLVAGLIAGFALLPAYLETRAEATGVPTQGRVLVASDAHRLRAWQASVAMVADRPLTGQGFQSYRRLHWRYGDALLSAPHNEWLRFFAEEGVVAGTIGLAFLALVGAALYRTRGWVASGALGAFVGWVVAASFNNPLLFIQVTAIIFTVVGIGLGYRPPPEAESTEVPSTELAPSARNQST